MQHVKKVVMLTRPIAPPWDEASKNLAMYLVKRLSIPNVECILLTTKGFREYVAPHVRLDAIHTTKALTIQNKIKLFWYLLRTDAPNIHCLFVLTPLTGLILRFLKTIKGFKIIQTVSSLSQNRLLFSLSIFGDQVVCFSKTTAQILKDHGVSPTVIPPGVPLSLFTPGKKKNVIAFLGELYRLGSFDLVARLVELLLQEFPDYSIVLGFRTTRKPKEELALVDTLKRKWHGNTRVSFTDVIEDMPSFLATVKLVIVPATQVTEKFDYPMVLLEALACATPVVISPVGPLAELALLPGVASPPNNTPEALLGQAKEMLNRFKTQSKAARATAQKYFDIDQVTRQYELLYQKTFI